MKNLEKILLGLVIFGLVFVVMSCGKASVKMVKIPDRNFEMLQTEVTQDLYESVMGENPSNNNGKNNPVENVSWYDAIYFCNKLSELKGYEPVYFVDGITDTAKWNYTPHQGISMEGGITQNLSANGYRLPTVEEWKFSAKGGQDYIYAGSNKIDEVAWYELNSNWIVHPVAQKKPNGYGLYDMSGNLFEWCWDPARFGSRYFCGGCYISLDDCKVSYGDYGEACNKGGFFGFRIVRTIK